MNARPSRFTVGARRPLDLAHGRVDMSHGAGGRAMQDLIEQVFKPAFDNPALARGEDQAVLTLPPGPVALSTDTYVVSPLFFPGGDIGCLAVHGTVNDVAMAGATPLYLTAGFVIEEGFPLCDLVRIARSMADAAREAGVSIVTGDTKVVERGKGDGVFINTAGVGVISHGRSLGAHAIRPGDAVLVSGTIGDHGVAVMAHRQGLTFETTILSDSAPLNGLVEVMLAVSPNLRALRDPTRGGVSATLNEFAHQSGHGVVLEEAAVPVRPEVAGACELLGLDPLTIANEGKLLAIAPAEEAEALLQAMRAHPRGADSAIIGRVVADPQAFVRMTTLVGGQRVVDWLAGEQLPRIC
jgi:hydrogenase expression/formation protein HypE